MMTKHASPLRTWLAATGSALLLGTLTVLLSTRTVAQQTDAFTPKTTVPKPVKRLPQPSVAEMEQQFGRVQVRFTCREDGMKTRQKKFADLTPEQKGRVILIQPMPPTAISEVELQALKNPKKYGIWVDGKRDRNFTNNRTLKASDIIAYNSSFVHKNARQPAGYSYQVDLLTDTAYSAYVKQMQDRPTLILVTKERLEQWQKAHPVR